MTGFVVSEVRLPSVAATELFARQLSLWVRPGLVIALQGDLGAGKSTIARAFIRSVANDPALDVPSPTFSLVQTYDELRVPLVHADLYRLSGADEAEALGLTDLLADHAVLVEWPERLDGHALGPDVLTLAISGSGEQRVIKITAGGRWHQLLGRDLDIETFLTRAGLADADRSFLLGDASTRRYERITASGNTTLLMDMPHRSDHMVIRHGKSYSALVHLADHILPVLAINRHLRELGYSAAEIYHADAESGLALIEWLDGELHGDLMRAGRDVLPFMRNAVEVLADMAKRDWPREAAAGSGQVYRVPDFDLDAMLFEVDLMPSWFWPKIFGAPAPQAITSSFEMVWRELLPLAAAERPYWVMRDFHSPNLIWLPDREGLRRTGVIDTQDAVMGHPAYDLVSLLQDARVDVSPEIQHQLYQHYLIARGDFDSGAFARAYAILGAQRATRLIGTFTRLSVRDGKHHYLQHRPRVARYLAQNLVHPALAPLKRWYETNAPQVLELARS
jgi:tRNA threonylcarbamoyl adenosine modification protein YjeE